MATKFFRRICQLIKDGWSNGIMGWKVIYVCVIVYSTKINMLWKIERLTRHIPYTVSASLFRVCYCNKWLANCRPLETSYGLKHTRETHRWIFSGGEKGRTVEIFFKHNFLIITEYSKSTKPARQIRPALYSSLILFGCLSCPSVVPTYLYRKNLRKHLSL